MITFGTPAFLLAGALAALVPLALHLIRRRPPARAPLPTERFLAPNPRTSVRVSRPTDPLLLALRMLLLILAGAAFARPVWLPDARGASEIVLLDRGAAMASGDGGRQAVFLARQRLLGADGVARGELILFDTAAVRSPGAASRPRCSTRSPLRRRPHRPRATRRPCARSPAPRGSCAAQTRCA